MSKIYKVKFDDGETSYVLDEPFIKPQDAEDFIKQIITKSREHYSVTETDDFKRIDINDPKFQLFCDYIKINLRGEGKSDEEAKNIIQGFEDSIETYNNLSPEERELYSAVGEETFGTTGESFADFMDKPLDEQAKISSDAFKRLRN